MKHAFALALALFTSNLTAEENGKTFDANGVTIWYEEKGGGPATPLVIVNGGPGFDHVYEHLGDAVWDRLVGGYLVMAYSARHPERLRHLVIVDAAAPKISDTKYLFNDIFPETTAKQDGFNFADTLGDKNANAESLKLYLTMLFYSPEMRDAAQPTFRKSVFTKEVNEAVSADLTKFDLNPELLKFAFPTLVITGRYDINVAPSVAWKIHKAVPGSQFAVFEKSGHLPFYEEPDAFAKTVETFLAR